ncbi:MAG: type II toxin-antitoxin system RelE/ParE family toxin [Candidatus Micrarchaeota archaeon]
MPDPYEYDTLPSFDKKAKKYLKKDELAKQRVKNKVKEILKDPHHYKSLSNEMKGLRRVHVGSFVLIFEIDEKRRAVIFVDYEHHDKVYKN